LSKEINMRPSSWKFFLCLAAVVVFAGCGGGGSEVGATAVSGTVTLDGQPVEGANVAFAPKGEGGRAATGITDAEGKFTLTTLEAGDGAMPGSYGVTVTKKSGGSAGFVDPRDQGGEMTPEQMKAVMEAAEGGAQKSKDELPAKYASADTSGLTADVSDSGGNDFTLELTSK
jgi:hypothetical protein